MNDEQWAEYLSEVLKRLDAHARQLPTGAVLREIIQDASEPLACLIGYFSGGIANNPDKAQRSDATQSNS